MSSAASATGKGNPHSQVTPFDQVLACEEREEARIKDIVEELKQKEQEAELTMRASEQTQEEKWRSDARDMLVEERDAIGKKMESAGQEIEKEGRMLEETARKRMPAITEKQVQQILSPDFLSLTA